MSSLKQKHISQSWSAVSHIKKRINFNDKTSSINFCFPAVVLKWNVVSQCFRGRGSAYWEGNECFLCVSFLAFLHFPSLLLDNSFWEPAPDLITIKADFYFHFHLENTQDIRGRISSCTSLFFENVVVVWIVTYQRLNLCSKVGMSLRAASEHVGILWLLLQTQVWMMMWVRVCALLNFLNQIPYYGSQCSAFTLGCFEPSRILLFQSVSRHNFGGFFWEVGVTHACIPWLPCAWCVGAKPRGPVSQNISANQ